MTSYLTNLGWWTFFCWLAVSTTVGVVVIMAILYLDYLTRGSD